MPGLSARTPVPLLTFAAIVLAAPVAHASVRLGPGTTCTHPDIASAVAASSNGQEIYISPGTYAENLGYIDHDLSFIAATAGCAGPAATRGGVTIDGSGAQVMHVGISAGTSVRVTLRNLVVSNGVDPEGGLVFVSAGGTFVMENSVLVGGSTDNLGGALFVDSAGHAELRDGSRLLFNQTTGTGQGAAAAVMGGSLWLYDDSLIGLNASVSDGGGVYVDDGVFVLWDDSSVVWNAADGDGGGIYGTNGARVELWDRASVANNNAVGDGGGICVRDKGSMVQMSQDSIVANNDADGAGGGIFARETGNGGASVDGGAVVTDNTAGGNGGGIHVWESSLSVTTATVSNNVAQSGGGIYANGSTVTVRNTDIDGNETGFTSWGGGLMSTGSTVDMINVRIRENTGDLGGGMYLADGSVLTMDIETESCNPAGLPIGEFCSEIRGNTTNISTGGGIFAAGNAIATIERTGFLDNTGYGIPGINVSGTSDIFVANSLFAGNSSTTLNDTVVVAAGATFDSRNNTFADNGGTAVRYDAGSVGRFHRNIVWGNWNGITGNLLGNCNDVQPSAGVVIGINNISADPQFGNAAARDYRLRLISPALDACGAGTNFDIVYTARPQGAGFEMGAYERVP